MSPVPALPVPTLPPVDVTPRLAIAVLVSGSGSNLGAILDRQAADAAFGARVVLVLADRHGIKALDRAKAAGVPWEVVNWGDYADRVAFTSAVCDVVGRYGAEALVLAGFMRVLAPEAVERFPHRILNTHPALLPAFPGAHGVRDALAHGVKVSGVTVHFVDEQVDHGPIIAQEAVAVHEGDDVSALHARIQSIEHRLYPEVIDAFAKGRLHVGGRKVIWS